MVDKGCVLNEYFTHAMLQPCGPETPCYDWECRDCGERIAKDCWTNFKAVFTKHNIGEDLLKRVVKYKIGNKSKPEDVPNDGTDFDELCLEITACATDLRAQCFSDDFTMETLANSMALILEHFSIHLNIFSKNCDAEIGAQHSASESDNEGANTSCNEPPVVTMGSSPALKKRRTGEGAHHPSESVVYQELCEHVGRDEMVELLDSSLLGMLCRIRFGEILLERYEFGEVFVRQVMEYDPAVHCLKEILCTRSTDAKCLSTKVRFFVTDIHDKNATIDKNYDRYDTDAPTDPVDPTIVTNKLIISRWNSFLRYLHVWESEGISPCNSIASTQESADNGLQNHQNQLYTVCQGPPTACEVSPTACQGSPRACEVSPTVSAYYTSDDEKEDKIADGDETDID